VGAAAAGRQVVAPGATGGLTLLPIGVAGMAFVIVDLVLRRYLPTTGAPGVTFAAAWPVEVSLLCAAALLAVAYRQGEGPWMAGVALLPLVLTRFAFDRYAAAQEAYRQTIKALSIVPEVAGVTPFGHGERSAYYATNVALALGLAPDAVERVA